MKILIGVLRGRTVLFKPNPNLRPTADKTRKAIFDMLQGGLEGVEVLDLFSGTGALGFEALSSGAVSVTFVESERAQALEIKKSLEKLGLSDKGEVLIEDVLKAIERFSRDSRTFDLIFMDPPYEKGLGEKALSAIAKAKIVKKGALIVLECRESEDLPDAGADFAILKNKVYGDTRIVVYRQDSRGR